MTIGCQGKTWTMLKLFKLRPARGAGQGKKRGPLAGGASGPGVQRSWSRGGKLAGGSAVGFPGRADPGRLRVGRTGYLRQPSPVRAADGGIRWSRWGKRLTSQGPPNLRFRLLAGSLLPIASPVPTARRKKLPCRNSLGPHVLFPDRALRPGRADGAGLCKKQSGQCKNYRRRRCPGRRGRSFGRSGSAGQTCLCRRGRPR
jgi:hypothetical protein